MHQGQGIPQMCRHAVVVGDHVHVITFPYLYVPHSSVFQITSGLRFVVAAGMLPQITHEARDPGVVRRQFHQHWQIFNQLP